MSLLVHDELGEVPGDFPGLLFGVVVEGRVLSQVLVHFVSVGAIDVDFLEDRELSSILLSGKSPDLLVGARLLLHELVAGEGKDFESLVLQLAVHVHQLSVVGVRQSSLGGHVHHHNALLSLSDFSDGTNRRPLEESRRNIEQCGVRGPDKLVVTTLLHRL